jgi:hypothetical protein
MPENASRFAAALYDQFEDEHQVADWGGDELFTRMPRPRAVDTAPAPRFRPSPAAAEPPRGAAEPSRPASRRPLALVDPPADRRRRDDREWTGSRDRRRGSLAEARTAEAAMLQRAERLGLTVVDGTPAHRWDDTGSMIEQPPAGRPTKVITGRPDHATTGRPGHATPPLPVERRRPARTPAEWIGPRPERIVAWAFVLGLILILIAIFTS